MVWHDVKGSKVKSTDFIRALKDLWKIHRAYNRRRMIDTALRQLTDALALHARPGTDRLGGAEDRRRSTRAHSGGRSVTDLTVGDFSPAEFRIPAGWRRSSPRSWPPARRTIRPRTARSSCARRCVELFRRDLGLTYPLESTLIAGGSRPIIYAAYAASVDRGDKVVYPTPSWNNNHYTYLTGGVPVELVVGADTNFMPTAEMIRPHVRDARLIAVCTPLNPTGTVMAREEVEKIATLVVEENERRAASGERALFLLWDQVYWMLTFGENRHWAPPQVVPES